MHSITEDGKIITNDDLERIYDNICRQFMTLCVEGRGSFRKVGGHI